MHDYVKKYNFYGKYDLYHRRYKANYDKREWEGSGYKMQYQIRKCLSEKVKFEQRLKKVRVSQGDVWLV